MFKVSFNTFVQLCFSMKMTQLEFSSLLIYSELRAGLYTEWIELDAVLIKHRFNCDLKEIKTNQWKDAGWSIKGREMPRKCELQFTKVLC